jgi:unsaturated rhamnogalacturonyl hydrolase
MMERAARYGMVLLVLSLSWRAPFATLSAGSQATAGQLSTAGAPPEALRALVANGNRSVVVDAAGLTTSGRRLWAIEPAGGGDAKRPTLVLIGGLDGDPAGTATVMRVLRWWFTDRAAASLRAEWQIAALPCARPDLCDASLEAPHGTNLSAAIVDGPAPLAFPPAGGFFDGKLDPTPHYVWRWTTMQAPTVVIDVRVAATTSWQANALAGGIAGSSPPAADGSLAAALATGGAGAAWSMPVPALRLDVAAGDAVKVIAAALPRAARLSSPLRTTLTARAARAPLDVARLLAPKYPAQPIMSYIPALSWSGALKVATITGEARFRDKPVAEMAPFVSGAKPAIAEPFLLTSLAGHLALSDWGELDGNGEAAAAARKGADFILPQEAGGRDRASGSSDRGAAPSGEAVRFPRGWTDDMFMAVSVLGRVAARTKGDDRYAATAVRLLTTYADQLQRPDGLFMHAKEGPHAWGRGNGFAALGLMDALTYLPADLPDRGRVLQSYQALMKGLIAQQAPDGMWRQVVDEPGSYREFTVTAMVLTAMARGVRLGWLDASYLPVVERAWRALLARIAEDGSLMDVCTGTGSGPTREYYLNRAGISGADDRGGAMALTAALEMHDLARAGGPR